MKPTLPKNKFTKILLKIIFFIIIYFILKIVTTTFLKIILQNYTVEPNTYCDKYWCFWLWLWMIYEFFLMYIIPIIFLLFQIKRTYIQIIIRCIFFIIWLYIFSLLKWFFYPDYETNYSFEVLNNTNNQIQLKIEDTNNQAFSRNIDSLSEWSIDFIRNKKNGLNHFEIYSEDKEKYKWFNEIYTQDINSIWENYWTNIFSSLEKENNENFKVLIDKWNPSIRSNFFPFYYKEIMTYIIYEIGVNQ